MDDLNRVSLATMAECSCGGRGPDDPLCCPACKVWHNYNALIEQENILKERGEIGMSDDRAIKEMCQDISKYYIDSNEGQAAFQDVWHEIVKLKAENERLKEENRLFRIGSDDDNDTIQQLEEENERLQAELVQVKAEYADYKKATSGLSSSAIIREED